MVFSNHFHVCFSLYSQVTSQRASKRRRLNSEEIEDADANFGIAEMSPAPFDDEDVKKKPAAAMSIGKMI